MNVVRFTIKNKIKSKAFIITAIVLAVILSIAINIPYFIQLFSSDEPKRIGMFDDGSIIKEMLAVQVNELDASDMVIVFYPSAASPSAEDALIRAEIAEGTVEGFLQLEVGESVGFPNIVFKSDRSLDFGTSNMLRNVLSNIKMELALQDLELTLEQRESIFSPINIETVQISLSGAPTTDTEEGATDKSESEMMLTYGLVYVLIILFFMGTMISGQLIATEITSEKSSRVMEILITSTTPLTQMFGKIFGMFVVGISQIILYLAVVLININLPHNTALLEGFDINLGDIPVNLWFYFVLFYLLGYFLYATIFAAIGSLVSRTEDLGQAIMPVTFLTLAAFYIGIFGMNQPSSTFMTAMSYIPFFSPIVMYIRIAMADPAIWEIALSLGILLVTIYFMGWLSARIYRTGVLMYGKRPSFKELRKAMKAFKTQ